MDEKTIPIDLLGKWIESLIESLDEFTDEKARKEIIEKCGRACALYHGETEKINAIKRQRKNLEEVLDQMNQEGMWCGDWIKEGNIIYSTCKRCGCPLVKSGIIKLSPTFCYCSCGWVKSIFEDILEEPVRVELKKAIGRGDNVCQFVVHQINKEIK